MMLGKELINVFSPDVLILFDVGAGELMKAALSQRVLSVGIVPNKAHKEMLMNILRKFVEGMNLVNLADGCPTKSPTMIKFETDHPDNSDVRASAANIGLNLADPASPRPGPPPTTPPVTPKAYSPTPKVIIAQPSAAAASGSQQSAVLQFGTSVL